MDAFKPTELENDIVHIYQVAQSMVAENPSLLWRYDQWNEVRRNLESLPNASLHSLCRDLALEQSLRNASATANCQDGQLSRLTQKELGGLCSHAYYEIRRRFSEYKKTLGNESDSEVSIPVYFAFHKSRRTDSTSTSPSSLVTATLTPSYQNQLSTPDTSVSNVALAPLAPTPYHIRRGAPNVLDLCLPLYQMTKDKKKYRALLRQRGNDAQVILDFLQMALDVEGLNPKLQKRLLITALRLSSKASLYPKCFTLREVEVEESAVTAGHFGEIWKGRFRGQAVCLKVVKVYQRSHIEDLLKAFAKEGILWGHLHHENVLPFYGIYHLVDSYSRICLTSPWMDHGNINEHLKRNPDASRMLLVLDTIEGISYLHANGVIHGDLKGANILITPRGRACIADFGLSSVVDAEILRWTSLESSASIGGTVRWSAPELMDPENENARPSTASDIYAFSCVCYEVFTGSNPFFEIARDPAVMLKVMRGDRPTPPPRNSRPCRQWGLTPHVWALMGLCWQQDPSARPTAVDVIDSIHKIIRVRVASGSEEFTDDRPGTNWDSISPSKFRNAVHQSVDLQAVDRIILSLTSSH